MIILGINAYHGDSSACVVEDGRLVAAVEEERFKRIKHWAGFPDEAIRHCLKAAAVTPSQVGHVAVNRDPGAHLMRKIWHTVVHRLSVSVVARRVRNAFGIRQLGFPSAKTHFVEHHRAHLASAFFVSPFEEAAVASVDGFGDFRSALWGVGRDNRLRTLGSVNFPHSLGLFYLAITQFLGFRRYGDEYKVMGLAAHGRPTEIDKMRRLVRLKPDGGFRLNLEYFRHHSEGVAMTWEGGQPWVDIVYSRRLLGLLGPARAAHEPIGERHKNIAASAQKMYEEVLMHFLRHVHARTRLESLCLAGGCAMNSVANGKIQEQTPFKKLYVPCAPGDAGGAIGAAYVVWNETLGQPRSFVMEHGYWGPEFGGDEVLKELTSRNGHSAGAGYQFHEISDEDRLCLHVARALADGKIVGWFQGRMEWGPRALGNRSILCDPRLAGMKDTLNQRIKRRENFRPFAPSILKEAVTDWFETRADIPFMSRVHPVRAEKRTQVPAVTHVDGSARLQTVAADTNSRYHRLIKTFRELTGVPLLLNTSFNENEPIVCEPSQALDCFLRTRMDVLVMGDYFVEKSSPNGSGMP